MAKVKMLIDISGTVDGKHYPGVGGTIDVPAHVAEKLVSQGYAERGSAPKGEKATAKPKGQKRSSSKE